MRHGNYMTTAEGEGFQIDNEAFLLFFKGKNLLPNCSKFIQLSFEFTRFYVISGKSFYVHQSIRLFKAEFSCRWLSALRINY